MNIKKNNTWQLKKLALQSGAGLFAVADLKKFGEEVSEEIKPLIKGFDYGISIGIELSAAVLETLSDKPNLIYSWHYRQVNTLLDSCALKVSRFIQNKGFRSLPIAASQVVDWQNQKAHLSHRHLAQTAGMGWLGRNNLLVTKKYGAQLRLVSVLTDMPLLAGKEKNSACGKCRICIEVCPAKAIGELTDDFKRAACVEKVKEFSRLPGIKYHICGICVKACKGRQ